MFRRRLSSLIFSLLCFASCESSLYPPTYPPVLSDLTITTTTSNEATTSIIQGDTVYISVNVEDPEDDSSTLSITVLSDETEIYSKEIDDSWIFGGLIWENWFDTDDMDLGDYTLQLIATDDEGNEGDPITESITVTSNLKTSVDTSDITISAVSYTLKDEVQDEPFTITFSVSNNSPVTIDIVHVPFTVTATYDNGVDTAEIKTIEGDGVITNIPAGSTKEGYLKLNVQTNFTTYNSMSYAEADCTITIY
ncbi:hypothetical protein EXM22_17870 [Oceanispirochaeta crateris]|uniref:Cadherin domain-containing protein n=1 Tax=Oceanispirochaeta crateris TaxID=2518645 RepID=A0A5C1QRC3_9SPIO|nr:hypothetical protein [Oceanispirochaeta crateris]QEN09759.1 hypothetical protein EXM22_17870 [Oceanispirochaeta crateris]